MPRAGHKAHDGIPVIACGMRYLCEPLQLCMPDLGRKEEASQDSCALRPQILCAFLRRAAVGDPVEAAQKILIVTHGLGPSRERRGAGAAHYDRDEPPLVQSLFLGVEAIQAVDAHKEVTQGALGVFAGKPDGHPISSSRVDDRA